VSPQAGFDPDNYTGPQSAPKPDRGPWVQTHSGIAFYPLDPLPHEVLLPDIAHALARICRFTGHTREFYSVAEHSVRVSHLCEPQDALWGLLHDAAEAYLTDLAGPLKHHHCFAKYRDIEAKLQAVIMAHFQLPAKRPASVQRADRMMLAIERRDLMPITPRWEDDDELAELIDGCTANIDTPLPPVGAEGVFLSRFRELNAQRASHLHAPAASKYPFGGSMTQTIEQIRQRFDNNDRLNYRDIQDLLCALELAAGPQ
jgi:hypothetical protein